MGFKFTYLCDLLSSLEENRITRTSTQARKTNPDVQVITQWFAEHGKRVRGTETDKLALLSCMFPEKRVDRVFWLQDTSLARVIGRCLLLGSSRRQELERWRLSGQADLGQCVENVMRQAENHIANDQEVTVEEIDFALNQIASRCRFSGPRVRRQRAAVDIDQTLSPLYRRLSSRDAKWLTRMILKSYLSVALPQKLTLKNFHFLLPHLLIFQDSFKVALRILESEPISNFPAQPEPGLAKDLGKIALQYLTPTVGVKIGRPEYYKARSIKHCCQLVGRRRMSVERKYDGEYCQIHIDLSNHPNSIQIFSKSGKDSTQDRLGIHGAIKDALRVGKPGCKFSHRCILEGELVVWNDKNSKISEFHKLRKFISRSGTFIGTENDSPPQPYEHLMMIFFDVLLLDDDICLRKPHRERRLLLKDAVQVIPGYADIADQRVLDFSHTNIHARLEGIFAKGIAERWEGFILKGCEDPYFTISSTGEGSVGRWIKLKKDYIPGLGDTIDLGIIGATYNSRDAATLGLVSKVSWTHFFVGCLVNREAVLHSEAKPSFRVLDVINHHCMSEQTMLALNGQGKYTARKEDSDHGFEIEYGRAGLPRMEVVFQTPFVVEMLGSGFEKPSGARFYTLRFPRITKILSDRSFEDAASFPELQLLAENAVSVPHHELLAEQQEWARRVKTGTSTSQYILRGSQGLVTTTRSFSISESEVTSATGELPASGAFEVDHDSSESPASRFQSRSEVTKTKTDFVPIYVDQVTVSNPSDDSFKPQRHFLTINENVSSYGNSRKRKASCSLQEAYHKVTPDRPGEALQITPKIQGPISNIHNLSLRVANMSAPDSQPSTANKCGALNRYSKGGPKHIESPFQTLPLYLDIAPSFFGAISTTTKLCNTTDTLDKFFHFIKSYNQSSDTVPSNFKTSPRHTDTLGLIFTDTKQSSLSTTLFELYARISKGLQFPTLNPNYPAKGQIFILSAKFLELSTLDLRDTRFCLRKTWENISKEYFYSCVAWGSMADAAPSVDEIPGTPMGRVVHVEVNNNKTSQQTDIPKVSIRFDRKELLILGNYVSLEPLVLVNGCCNHILTNVVS